MVPTSVSHVQAAYDQVADAYAREFSDELTDKPLDRALLAAFVEMVGPSPIADIGCGPGHVTRFLAEHHPDVAGVDLSPGMIGIARDRAPELVFTVASMLRLPVPDATWAGVISLYSVIHLSPDERPLACRELARVLRPGGWLLIAFHVDSDEFAAGGDVNHLTHWFGKPVDLDGYFLDPDSVAAELDAAGLATMAKARAAALSRCGVSESSVLSADPAPAVTPAFSNQGAPRFRQLGPLPPMCCRPP